MCDTVYVRKYNSYGVCMKVDMIISVIISKYVICMVCGQLLGNN